MLMSIENYLKKYIVEYVSLYGMATGLNEKISIY